MLEDIYKHYDTDTRNDRNDDHNEEKDDDDEELEDHVVQAPPDMHSSPPKHGLLNYETVGSRYNHGDLYHTVHGDNFFGNIHAYSPGYGYVHSEVGSSYDIPYSSYGTSHGDFGHTATSYGYGKG